MAFTYKQIEPLFHKVLRRYCSKKYELDELTNEVWLRGRVQKATTRAHCVWLMKRDVMNYMKQCEGRFVKGRPQARKRTTFISLQAIRCRGLSTKEPGPLACAVERELKERLLTGLETIEQQILLMRWNGLNYREAGLATGLSKSRVAAIGKAVVEKCRVKVG